MIEGFCRTSQRDEPLTPDGYCEPHGDLPLPPSWGSRAWKWAGDTWTPYTPRPEGYVWVPKFMDDPTPKPVTAKRVTSTTVRPTQCERCGKLLDGKVRGGSVQRYCSLDCKVRTSQAKKRADRAAAKAAPAPEVVLCRVCREPVPQPANGGRKHDHSGCHRKFEAPAQTTSMRERGIVAACGHDDRPVHARGQCRPCWNRAYRQDRREARKAAAV